MSTLELTSCGRSITISVFEDEDINLLDIYQNPVTNLLDFYTGQIISVSTCADILDLIMTDSIASGFLSIRDRSNNLILTRANDYINMRAA